MATNILTNLDELATNFATTTDYRIGFLRVRYV
jgi:hypothetical protein